MAILSRLAASVVGAALVLTGALYASVEDALPKLTALGREGSGNEAATIAWQEIVKAGPPALLPILRTAGQGTAVADNWLRVAADAITDHALHAKQALPLLEVRAFLLDTKNGDAGRLIAWDLLQLADKTQADALEPSFLDDPVQELRRGAVQRIIDAAKAAATAEERKPLYEKALAAVRDEDQTKTVAHELKALGVTVDLPKHFGFVMNWQVIGPFDNKERKGYETAFPPEKEVKLDASYEGKEKQVNWQPFTSTDEYGKVDFNKPLGMQKEVTAYAMSTFDSPVARPAELRLGCKNAWKVWLNGEFLFGRDEYHRGQQIDQYKIKCQLRAGHNTILVKACQNEQKEEWTVEWEFQLRVCDSAGTAILSGP